VRDAANHMIECVGQLTQARAGDGVIVRVAHMELARPTIAEGLAACVEAGATEVVVFPYMLSPGKHSTRDIPRLSAEAAAAFPLVSVTVTPAFGVHDKLAEVVLERAGVGVVSASAPPACICVRPEGAPERWCGDACREGAVPVSASH
jgi:sirohydrochlorin ferrochelatase